MTRKVMYLLSVLLNPAIFSLHRVQNGHRVTSFSTSKMILNCLSATLKTRWTQNVVSEFKKRAS